MRKTLKIFLFIGAPLALAACQTVPVAYQKPDVGAPAAWNAAASSASATPRQERPDWWLGLNDPTLNTLMQAALAQNLDVKATLARVDEARALSRIQDARYKPNVSLSGNATLEGGLKAQGGLNDADARLSGGVNASWEPDIYGLQRLESQLGRAGFDATDAQYRGVVNALMGEVARAYIDLRQQQQILVLLRKNIDLQAETLRMIKIQTSAGAGVQLDVLRAQAQVETTQSQLPNVMAAMQIDCNRIAVLLGETPGSRDKLLKADQAIPAFAATIGLDDPAEVIAERPDVQNAEYQLEQQAAVKGIRSADMFPKISLSGFFGLSSSNLFGTSAPLNIVGDIARPLLDYGRIRNQLQAQDARQQQAFFAYRQTVLLAIEDVERSLVLYGQEQQRLTALQRTAGIQAEAARQARLRFQGGDATFLDVLIVEQQLLDAQLSEAQSRARLTTAGIDLYTALGASAAKTTHAQIASQ